MSLARGADIDGTGIGSSVEGSERSPRRGGARWTLAVAVAAAGSTLGACADDPSFAVGDCVRIEQRAIDANLRSANCEEARGTFDPSQRIYSVDSVIENTDGGCPALRGFFPVEFVHEPDGVTYCLVQAGS